MQRRLLRRSRGARRSRCGPVDCRIRRGAQVALFLNDVEPALAAEASNHVGPPGAGLFSSPLAIDAWPQVPIRGLAGSRDRFFPLEFRWGYSRPTTCDRRNWPVSSPRTIAVRSTMLA